MTKPNTENDLFEFAASRRAARTPDEQLLRELHCALGMQSPPTSLLRPSASKSSGKDNEMNAIAMQPVPPAPAWQPSRWLTIAAAMAIVLSMIGYGIWNIGGSQRPETPLAPYNPGLAMQSPAVGEECFTRAPLILEGNSFPVDVATVIVNDEGYLLLRCSAANEPVLLDKDVVLATNTGVPETILVYKLAADQPEDAEYPVAAVSLLNLRTGNRIELPASPEGALFSQQVNGPWYVAPSADNPGAIDVIDLRTLERHTILDADSASPATGAIATSSVDGSITAIGLITQDSLSGGGGFLVGRTSDQPEVLILHDTWDQGIWIPVDSPDDPVDDLLMSPDGTYLALEVVDGVNSYGIKRVLQYLIMEPNSGEELASTEVERDYSISSKAWSLDSASFIYASGTALKVLEPGVSSQPRTVLEGVGGVEMITLTSDPNLVLVDLRTPSQEPIATTNRVNLATGEIEVLGEQSLRPYFPITKRTPMIVVEDGSTIRYLDSATSMELATSIVPSTSEATPAPPEDSGTVGIIESSPAFTGFGTDNPQFWIWGDDLVMRSIPAPDFPDNMGDHVFYSTDDSRFILVESSTFATVVTDSETVAQYGPPKSLYILDTEAPEPVWIPIE